MSHQDGIWGKGVSDHIFYRPTAYSFDDVSASHRPPLLLKLLWYPGWVDPKAIIRSETNLHRLRIELQTSWWQARALTTMLQGSTPM
jgi:hypothetical protein